jgi:hypothetical protein
MNPSQVAGLILSKSESNQMAKTKIKRIRTLTIDRTKWGRNNKDGEMSGGSIAVGPRDFRITGGDPETVGKMCCLGFACLAYGVSERQIGPGTSGYGKGLPADVSKSAKKLLPKWLLAYERDLDNRLTEVGLLSGINDDSTLSDRQKEGRIRRVFAKHGIKVRFVK